MPIELVYQKFPAQTLLGTPSSGQIDWPDAGDTITLTGDGFTIDVADGTWVFVTDPNDPLGPGLDSALLTATLVSQSQGYMVEMGLDASGLTGRDFEDGFNEAELVSQGVAFNGAALAGVTVFGLAGIASLTRGTIGDDTLIGADQADTIVGDVGADSLSGGDGDDRIWAGALDTGDDTVAGGAGNDTLGGGGGDDSVSGDDGDDLMFGGSGADTMEGGTGADRGWAGSGDDLLLGDAGDDLLGGGAGMDNLIGGDGDDTLYGGSGRETLEGGAGNDVLFGGSEDDILIGGDGDDEMYGGTGADTFYFDSTSGNDSIGGFSSADGDTLDLSALNLAAGMASLSMQQFGADLWINTGVTTIYLYNTDMADLDAGDFVF